MICLINPWVIPLKDKKGTTITNTYLKILDKSKRKPIKIWVDKGSEFYNRLMKLWLETKCIHSNVHSVKSVRSRSYSGPYFSHIFPLLD